MTIFTLKRPVENIRKLFAITYKSISAPANFDSEDLLCLVKEGKSLHHVRSIHQQALVRGLLTFPQVSSSISFIRNNIVAKYVSFDAITEAQTALETFCCSSVFCWNILIRQNISLGLLEHALLCCCRMQQLGTKPDHFTLPFILKACRKLSSFSWGASIHAIICKNGFDSNIFVCNSLIALYSRCGSLEEAIHVFDYTLSRGINDVVSWNSLIAAYVQRGHMYLALETFRKLVSSCNVDMGEGPDVISLVNVLPACAALMTSSHCKQIHCFSLRNGLFSDVFVGNAIIDACVKCEMMCDALRVFNAMEVKDIVSWNTMVSGYSQSGDFADAVAMLSRMHKEKIPSNVVTWSSVIAGYAQIGSGHEAICVFRQMQLSRSEPNAVTLISLLSACASVGALRQGMETHGFALRRCLLKMNDASLEGEDYMVTNALIDMYSKCKKLIAAHTLFDDIPLYDRSVVTWTVMIGGYSQHGDANSGLELFSQMLLDSETCPNDFTISCSLIASARLSALHFGKQIHAYVFHHGYDTSVVFVGNCLIDTYSKCGDIGSAGKVFSMMPQKNAVSWTSLITGYGMHGRGEEALIMFEKMQEANLVPDAITFLVVLYACNHSGMVDQGLRYFNSMSRDYGIGAGVEHYACVVDLLGRAGRLQEAQELIHKMPMKPTTIVWVALLGACRIHANLEIAEHAAKNLLELDSNSDGSYTLISNIYANARRWKDVARIRSLMKNNGIKKRPGCSWIQGKKGTTTFTFYVGDRSHPQSNQIHALLLDLIQRIKAIGYVPQTNFALHDVDEEEKSFLLSEHSEKLALAFGILTYSAGSTIRITKNLRVCGDCHSAFTCISKIVDHEIILRDPSRFHHFRKGCCSCGNYW